MIPALLGLAPQAFWLSTSAAAVGTLMLLVIGFGYLRKARLLEDTPTSRVRSAAQGYVELQGHARLMPGPEIVSPLSLTRCVWWRYTVQKLDRTRDKQEWVTVEKDCSGELFLLCDPTGDCVVDPDNAKVVPSIKRRWRGPVQRPCRPPDGSWIQFGDYRYVEELVLIGDLLYGIGWFRTQGIEQDFNDTQELRALLADWKKDQAQLLERFDHNKDGQIDLQEWEGVRRAALEQVRTTQVQRALNPDVHVLCKSPDRRPYILSTVTQQALTRRARLWATLCIAIGLSLGVYAVLGLQIRGFR
jgi:hypothetical protein